MSVQEPETECLHEEEIVFRSLFNEIVRVNVDHLRNLEGVKRLVDQLTVVGDDFDHWVYREVKLPLLWKLLATTEYFTFLKGSQYIFEKLLKSYCLVVEAGPEESAKLTLEVLAILTFYHSKQDVSYNNLPIFESDILYGPGMNSFNRYFEILLPVMSDFSSTKYIKKKMVLYERILERLNTYNGNVPTIIWLKVVDILHKLFESKNVSFGDKIHYFRHLTMNMESLKKEPPMFSFQKKLESCSQYLFRNVIDLINSSGKAASGQTLDEEGFFCLRGIYGLFRNASYEDIAASLKTIDRIEVPTFKWACWSGIAAAVISRPGPPHSSLVKQEEECYKSLRCIGALYRFESSNITQDLSKMVDQLIRAVFNELNTVRDQTETILWDQYICDLEQCELDNCFFLQPVMGLGEWDAALKSFCAKKFQQEMVDLTVGPSSPRNKKYGHGLPLPEDKYDHIDDVDPEEEEEQEIPVIDLTCDEEYNVQTSSHVASNECVEVEVMRDMPGEISTGEQLIDTPFINEVFSSKNSQTAQEIIQLVPSNSHSLCANGDFSIGKPLVSNEIALECEKGNEIEDSPEIDASFTVNNDHSIDQSLVSNEIALECEKGNEIEDSPEIDASLPVNNDHSIDQSLVSNEISLECEKGNEIEDSPEIDASLPVNNDHSIDQSLVSNEIALECEKGNEMEDSPEIDDSLPVNNDHSIDQSLVSNEIALECEKGNEIEDSPENDASLPVNNDHSIDQSLVSSEIALECEKGKEKEDSPEIDASLPVNDDHSIDQSLVSNEITSENTRPLSEEQLIVMEIASESRDCEHFEGISNVDLISDKKSVNKPANIDNCSLTEEATSANIVDCSDSLKSEETSMVFEDNQAPPVIDKIHPDTCTIPNGLDAVREGKSTRGKKDPLVIDMNFPPPRDCKRTSPMSKRLGVNDSWGCSKKRRNQTPAAEDASDFLKEKLSRKRYVAASISTPSAFPAIGLSTSLQCTYLKRARISIARSPINYIPSIGHVPCTNSEQPTSSDTTPAKSVDDKAHARIMEVSSKLTSKCQSKRTITTETYNNPIPQLDNAIKIKSSKASPSMEAHSISDSSSVNIKKEDKESVMKDSDDTKTDKKRDRKYSPNRSAKRHLSSRKLDPDWCPSNGSRYMKKRSRNWDEKHSLGYNKSSHNSTSQKDTRTSWLNEPSPSRTDDLSSDDDDYDDRPLTRSRSKRKRVTFCYPIISSLKTIYEKKPVTWTPRGRFRESDLEEDMEKRRARMKLRLERDKRMGINSPEQSIYKLKHDNAASAAGVPIKSILKSTSKPNHSQVTKTKPDDDDLNVSK